MKIGVFDSGLGGLSVLYCARKMIPNADFIYYADEEHVPYGEKSPKEIKGFVKEIFDFMMDKKVEGILIACNTATTVADKEFRKQFLVPIIGMEPAVKKAVDLYNNDNKRILVAATPVTINGNKLHKLVKKVDKNEKVDLIALPGLVRFAEKGVFTDIEVEEYLRNELSLYDLNKYGAVVLGCTHFNYFKEVFQKIFGKSVRFVDGNEGAVKQLMRLTSITADENNEGSIEYYFSGRKVSDEDFKILDKCMKKLDEVFDIN